VVVLRDFTRLSYGTDRACLIGESRSTVLERPALRPADNGDVMIAVQILRCVATLMFGVIGLAGAIT
jgi:hypothetical protein